MPPVSGRGFQRSLLRESQPIGVEKRLDAPGVVLAIGEEQFVTTSRAISEFGHRNGRRSCAALERADQ